MFGFFGDNSDSHEMRVRTCPGERFAFCLKKAIDDEGISLGSRATTGTRGTAIYDVRSGINGQTGKVGKENLCPVRNLSGIDCAMACAQARSVPAGVLARSGFVPIDGNARQNSLLGGRGEARAEKGEAGDDINKILHRVGRRLRRSGKLNQRLKIGRRESKGEGVLF